MRNQGFHLFAIFTGLTLLAGCASSLRLTPTNTRDSISDSCVAWFHRLDAVIDDSGARDAEAHRLPGYPYLRSNRFLASFAEDALADRTKFPAWLQAMRALDQHSRQIEIRNLPVASIRLRQAQGKEAALGEVSRCAAVLLASDSAKADTEANLVIASAVPDSYSPALRALGLYPLTAIAFMTGINRWQSYTAAEFSRPLAGAGGSAKQVRYVPDAGAAVGSPGEILARITRDTLGIPQLSDSDREKLLAAYGPIFEVDTTSDDDRVGSLGWRHGGVLTVDTQRPVVYRRIEFARFGKEFLTQLIYTLWFPRRTAAGAFDLLAGEFDGVIFRITLARDGQPLIADSIHACGCYHMFFPGPRLQTRAAPHERTEWAFVPAALPSLGTGSRFVIRLASGSHYMTGIGSSDSLEGSRYDTADEDSLRALPTGTDSTRSAYGSDGLIAGSERGERFLFWPMGIASAGAMRQWGHHATAFVGRRHFDDADLLEKRFAFIEEATTR